MNSVALPSGKLDFSAQLEKPAAYSIPCRQDIARIFFSSTEKLLRSVFARERAFLQRYSGEQKNSSSRRGAKKIGKKRRRDSGRNADDGDKGGEQQSYKIQEQSGHDFTVPVNSISDTGPFLITFYEIISTITFERSFALATAESPFFLLPLCNRIYRDDTLL